jgi:hypothetical protein
MLEDYEKKRGIELELLNNVIHRQMTDLQNDQRFKISFRTSIPFEKAREDGQSILLA